MPRTEKFARNLKRLADEAKDKQALLEKNPEYFRLDHPDQAQIHQDCQLLHKKLSLFQEQDLKNALELLLTFYCKSNSISYISGLHEILAPFFVLRFTTLKTVYGAFSAFIDKMMPRLFTKDSSISYSYKIFQRLLLYHDPLLSNLLQSTLPNNSSIIDKWFYTCMSACLDITQLLEFWEWCLTENNPIFPYYFAIALLMKNRDLLTKKHKKKINLEIHITDNDELTKIINDAQALQSSTPKFFNRLIKKLTILKEPPSSLDEYSLENTLILPISAKEVRKPRPGFFVIDVRRHKYYEQGHFPQSYNLSVDLHISTEELWSVLSGFSAYYHNKNSTACHFAFTTGPSQKEVLYASTLSLDVVRRGIERVSFIVTGIDDDSDHNANNCVRCKLNKNLIEIGKEGGNRPKKILSTMWQHYLMDDHFDKAPLHTTDGQKSTSRLNDISPKSTEIFIENSELTVHEVVKLMWTSNLLIAEDWFQRNLENDPRCAIHYAEAGFLKAVILGDNQSKEAVIERLDNAEIVAEKFVKKYETEGNKVFETKGAMLSPSEAMKIIKAAQNLRLALVVKAEATLFKSGNQILKNKLSLGSMNFRRAWKIYQKANKIAEAQKWVEKQYFSPEEIKGLQTQIEGDINNFIQFGEGVICLGLSMAPKAMSKLANVIIGIDGDQSRGLKILYDCINSKKGIRVPLALMFVLFWLLIYIPEFIPGKHERYREAHDLIRFALHYLPQSPYFYWLESYMNQRQGNLERALKLLNRVIAYSGRAGIDENPGRLSFERGWVLFLCQDWESARQSFEKSIEKGSDTPFTHLLLGVSYCMLNELQSAEDTLENIASYNKESSSIEEKWIHKRASSYLGRRWFQLFPFEISYVTDYLQGLKYDWLESSYDYLTSIDIEDSEEKDEIVISMLLQGAILRHLGRLREAVLILEAGIKLEKEVTKEIWVVPHIYYELGIVYVKSRDWTTSSAYIRKAKSFKRSYEFKASLSFKLNATLELILQEENKEFKK